MATVMKWDVQPGDGETVRLIFSDAEHGEDMVLEIAADNSVQQVFYDAETDADYKIPVSLYGVLHTALREYLAGKR